MVSVDICNEDIQFMQEEGSQWKACATTNWNLNGEFACRRILEWVAMPSSRGTSQHASETEWRRERCAGSCRCELQGEPSFPTDTNQLVVA